MFSRCVTLHTSKHTVILLIFNELHFVSAFIYFFAMLRKSHTIYPFKSTGTMGDFIGSFSISPMDLGQYNSLRKYCGPHTASSVCSSVVTNWFSFPTRVPCDLLSWQTIVRSYQLVTNNFDCFLD